MNAQRLLQRFLRYVQIDTMAREGTGTYPSSAGQWELGRLLVEELRAAGMPEVHQDEFALVIARLPATPGCDGPPIAYCAHMDTSPETSGAGVKPQVIADFRGGPIVLPADRSQVIRPEDAPELADLVGRTLITTDGTTLLGADDKAGLAVIVETAAWLVEHPEIVHGPIEIWFTCDEEIGHGVDHLGPYMHSSDGRLVPKPFAAERRPPVVCYTLDGSGVDTIDVETFSADVAEIVVTGVNIHPGVAKGRMVNAIRAASDLVARLPRTIAPEATEDREGFLHPYEFSGGVAEVRMRVLLRDFQTEGLRGVERLIQDAAAATRTSFPGVKIEITVKPQYRNMAAGLAAEPRAVGYAQEALLQLGRTAQLAIVRGGTDGSRLTELGLPSPNLSTGEHTPHSKLEFACLEEMADAVGWLVAIAQRWGKG